MNLNRNDTGSDIVKPIYSRIPLYLKAIMGQCENRILRTILGMIMSGLKELYYLKETYYLDISKKN